MICPLCKSEMNIEIKTKYPSSRIIRVCMCGYSDIEEIVEMVEQHC